MIGNMEIFLRRKVFAVALSIFWVIAPTLNGVPAHAQTSPKQPLSQRSRQHLGKSFASPEDASAALYAAAKSNDENALLGMFGPDAKGVITWSDNPDDRQSDSELFSQKYAQMHRLVKEPDGTECLYVGAENWPLPIPLVELNGAWYFDMAAGKNEIMYRRIGKNEMEAMEVCRSIADAEKDYYGMAHQYAGKFMSSQSAKDGLFWPVSSSTANSPIGPFLAHAGMEPVTDPDRAPFHGYFYRILLRQGPGAPGGARGYMVNGEMTGGFAILAFPAEYRSSGVMTFLMGRDGTIYEKDLGPRTENFAAQIEAFNPDAAWKKVE